MGGVITNGLSRAVTFKLRPTDKKHAYIHVILSLWKEGAMPCNMLGVVGVEVNGR